VLSNGHAEFGRRPGETHRWQHRQGAPGRPHRAEGKKHNAALICMARRRCDVLFAMLRNRTHYRHPEPATTPAAA
jgi:hypothetical protein